MEYHANGWLGRWQNFEAYLTSSDPYLTRAWQDAETQQCPCSAAV